MLGLMQDRPLLISGLIEYAARYHPDVEIVSRTCEGPLLRTNYAGLRSRAAKLAKALVRLGVKPGDRVATLAWNTHRHMELYFAVSGLGAVLHTVNPRLFPEQIAYIINHAEGRVLLFDITFADLVSKLRPKLATLERLVAMTDAAHAPGQMSGCLVYETLLEAEDDAFEWPDFDERTASRGLRRSGLRGALCAAAARSL
jgi:acyl-CoA synthetase (AMP-forming)/AMP-acid ligase II